MRNRQTIANKNEIIRHLVCPAPFPNLPDNAKLSEWECAPSVAKSIEALRRKLQTCYGLDYAFQIVVNGHSLAASNYQQGVIIAKPSPK